MDLPSEVFASDDARSGEQPHNNARLADGAAAMPERADREREAVGGLASISRATSRFELAVNVPPCWRARAMKRRGVSRLLNAKQRSFFRRGIWNKKIG
jgi:hypothetical protein